MRAITFALVLLTAASNSGAQVPPALQAPEMTPRDTITSQMKVVTDVKAGDGFMPDDRPLGRTVVVGLLQDRTVVHLELILDASRDYYIAAACDTDCDNIDTRVLNPNFSVLVEDILDNDTPHMDVKPAQSGAHLLAVGVASCRTELCYFGIVVLSRPARP